MSRPKKKANNTNTSNPVNLCTTFPFPSARSHKTQRRYSLTKDGPECGELALRSKVSEIHKFVPEHEKNGKRRREQLNTFEVTVNLFLAVRFLLLLSISGFTGGLTSLIQYSSKALLISWTLLQMADTRIHSSVAISSHQN